MGCFFGSAYAADWHVAVSGQSANTGAALSPWNLAYALQGAGGKIKAGDTLLLHGGRYLGLFVSTLSGTAAAPITVTSAPGEWAIIDGASFVLPTNVSLEVNGSYTYYKDFEVTNSNTDRPVTFPYRPATIDVFGHHTKFINLIVHDGGQGIGFWGQASDSEIYGCIIYNNGGEDRDHGIYTQNNTGTKLIEDNVIFNNYGKGIHAYGSGTTPLSGYTIRGNVMVNDDNIIGNRPVQNLTATDNMLYGASFNFGYNSASNINALIERNWFASQRVNFMGWKGAIVRNNSFWKVGDPAGALINMQYYDGYTNADYSFSKNKHYQFEIGEYNDFYIALPPYGGYGYKFTANMGGPNADGYWQDTLGYDLDGTYIKSAAARPSGTEIFVRPNKYDVNKAFVAIYNWDQKASVSVDISSARILNVGDTYVVKNALNYLSEPIPSSPQAYDGKPIPITMNNWSVASPVGEVPALTGRPSPFPDFGAFVIVKTSSAVQSPRPAAPKNLRQVQ